MPLKEMSLSKGNEGLNVSHHHPDYRLSDAANPKKIISRAVKSKRCHHLSGKRKGRTTFVKAIVSNPKLSQTQILAQKMAMEALGSQKMQDTFKKLSDMKNFVKGPVELGLGSSRIETNRIVRPSKIEKVVHKRHKGSKVKKHKTHKKQRRHNRKSGFTRATSKKESSRARSEGGLKCQSIWKRKTAGFQPQKRKGSIFFDGNQQRDEIIERNTRNDTSLIDSKENSRNVRNKLFENYASDSMQDSSKSQMSPPLFGSHDDEHRNLQLFERESMIAHLMRTTTKDPSKNSSGDQGVEYSEYYSDNDNLNSLPENEVQFKLNEVIKNLQVRSVRQAAIPPFLPNPFNGQRNNPGLQPIPYSSSALLNNFGRDETVQSAKNMVQKMGTLRKYDPVARNEIPIEIGTNADVENSFNHNPFVNANSNNAAAFSYINNFPQAHMVEQPVPIPGSPAPPERDSHQINQVPIATANYYPVLNSAHNQIPLLVSNNDPQRYAASGIPQPLAAPDISLQPVASVDFQSAVHTVNPMDLSPNYQFDIAGDNEVLPFYNNNDYASNTADEIEPSLSLVRKSSDNTMPEELQGEHHLSQNDPSSYNAGSPFSPPVLARPFLVPTLREMEPRMKFGGSALKLDAKKSTNNWPSFRGVNEVEAIAPQTFLQMKSPPSGEARGIRGRHAVFGEKQIIISSTKIPELNPREKGIGDASELPPEAEEVPKHGNTKTKTMKSMVYDLLPMTTLPQLQATGPASANITAMVNETKVVAGEILTKIMDELEELKLDHPKNEQKEGLPCRLTGSWVTIQAGVRIDMKVTNHSISVVLGNLIPPPLNLGLLKMTWNVTGHAPFKRGGPFTLIATDNHTKTLAVFVGACKVCQGIDTIEGLWTLSREPRDCRDFQMSTSVFNEIFRRTRLISAIEEKYRKHDASNTSASSNATSIPIVTEGKEELLLSKTAMKKSAIRGMHVFDGL